ncbi:MAG TPA: ABC transporter permease [Ilumatobacter sp.]|nr:ABC transporter permease [Ilumatobacter sp.]
MTRSVTERHQARFAQTSAMSRRAIMAVVRQPSIVIPSLLFPLFFVALGTSSFGRAIDVPGFPDVDSFLDFALAGAIVQGILFGSTVSATALATDIENGFFDRLLATPTSRTSILVGRLAGGMAYGGFQTILFIVILIPFGLSVKSGPIGVLAMVVGGVLVALAVGGLMSALALKTGSSESVQGAFPLLFILLFFSSTFFPRETMQGFHRTIADVNPVSFLAEGFRSLTIEPLSATALAETLLIPLALAVLALALSLRTLRNRLAAM